ncbi:hypothetical protein AMAG_05637 [Allomyces macrogynus ATCC 38327]|uniref:Uncharacterized protein n=1 Tax=Allomyces macrogynus (strain ATCC 38327) TaxID=578462 RepID=A0A0L0SCV6_ALLM3|nr:hypothetical protein AMAG_05637 [Allomyces macrogynus ATCC 38327]|eukprot:KNE60225.1 hypothetical protein AMAG_05637 [Allomyces macrogynus ATCC 38327]
MPSDQALVLGDALPMQILVVAMGEVLRVTVLTHEGRSEFDATHHEHEFRLQTPVNGLDAAHLVAFVQQHLRRVHPLLFAKVDDKVVLDDLLRLQYAGNLTTCAFNLLSGPPKADKSGGNNLTRSLSNMSVTGLSRMNSFSGVGTAAPSAMAVNLAVLLRPAAPVAMRMAVFYDGWSEGLLDEALTMFKATANNDPTNVPLPDDCPEPTTPISGTIRGIMTECIKYERLIMGGFAKLDRAMTYADMFTEPGSKSEQEWHQALVAVRQAKPASFALALDKTIAALQQAMATGDVPAFVAAVSAEEHLATLREAGHRAVELEDVMALVKGEPSPLGPVTATTVFPLRRACEGMDGSFPNINDAVKFPQLVSIWIMALETTLKDGVLKGDPFAKWHFAPCVAAFKPITAAIDVYRGDRFKHQLLERLFGDAKNGHLSPIDARETHLLMALTVHKPKSKRRRVLLLLTDRAVLIKDDWHLGESDFLAPNSTALVDYVRNGSHVEREWPLAHSTIVRTVTAQGEHVLELLDAHGRIDLKFASTPGIDTKKALVLLDEFVARTERAITNLLAKEVRTTPVIMTTAAGVVCHVVPIKVGSMLTVSADHYDHVLALCDVVEDRPATLVSRARIRRCAGGVFEMEQHFTDPTTHHADQTLSKRMASFHGCLHQLLATLQIQSADHHARVTSLTARKRFLYLRDALLSAKVVDQVRHGHFPQYAESVAPSSIRSTTSVRSGLSASPVKASGSGTGHSMGMKSSASTVGLHDLKKSSGVARSMLARMSNFRSASQSQMCSGKGGDRSSILSHQTGQSQRPSAPTGERGSIKSLQPTPAKSYLPDSVMNRFRSGMPGELSQETLHGYYVEVLAHLMSAVADGANLAASSPTRSRGDAKMVMDAKLIAKIANRIQSQQRLKEEYLDDLAAEGILEALARVTLILAPLFTPSVAAELHQIARDARANGSDVAASLPRVADALAKEHPTKHANALLFLDMVRVIRMSAARFNPARADTCLEWKCVHEVFFRSFCARGTAGYGGEAAWEELDTQMATLKMLLDHVPHLVDHAKEHLAVECAAKKLEKAYNGAAAVSQSSVSAPVVAAPKWTSKFKLGNVLSRPGSGKRGASVPASEVAPPPAAAAHLQRHKSLSSISGSPSVHSYTRTHSPLASQGLGIIEESAIPEVDESVEAHFAAHIAARTPPLPVFAGQESTDTLLDGTIMRAASSSVSEAALARSPLGSATTVVSAEEQTAGARGKLVEGSAGAVGVAIVPSVLIG